MKRRPTFVLLLLAALALFTGAPAFATSDLPELAVVQLLTAPGLETFVTLAPAAAQFAVGVGKQMLALHRATLSPDTSPARIGKRELLSHRPPDQAIVNDTTLYDFAASVSGVKRTGSRAASLTAAVRFAKRSATHPPPARAVPLTAGAEA
jgi:hypothetical protein